MTIFIPSACSIGSAFTQTNITCCYKLSCWSSCNDELLKLELLSYKDMQRGAAVSSKFVFRKRTMKAHCYPKYGLYDQHLSNRKMINMGTFPCHRNSVATNHRPWSLFPISNNIFLSVAGFHSQGRQLMFDQAGLHSQSTCSTCTSRSTIYAVSSGFGKAGVAVIRISGPAACATIYQMVGLTTLPPARRAQLRIISDPESQVKIDRGLVLWFPGSRSFTGEDCCELHVHGGPAVITATLSALAKLPGYTHAEPGDFTKRAFQNGKLDLTEVEGLADLIHAETEAQRRQAMRQMEGDLSHTYSKWREILLKCVANQEAYIDFSEDDNLDDNIIDYVNGTVRSLVSELTNHLEDNRRGERLRTGVRVAILGEPNVGKSSLLNVICGRPAAIVSPIAGTTRDVVESALDIGGYPIVLSDTAGLRHTTDFVEQEGVKRAKQRASEADLIIIVVDVTTVGKSTGDSPQRFLERLIQLHLGELHLFSGQRDEADQMQCSHLQVDDTSATVSTNVILVLNKSDLLDVCTKEQTYDSLFSFKNGRIHHTISSCTLSCQTMEGLDEFMKILKKKVEHLCGDPSVGNPSLTQQRHRDHLTSARASMLEYQNYASKDIVIATEYLQMALWHIGKVTGQVSSEEVLDVIFRDFCIGK